MSGIHLSPVPPLRAPLRGMDEHDALSGNGPYIYEVTNEVGCALVVGVRHCRGLEDNGLRVLEQRFAAYAPTLALAEGNIRWHFGGQESLVVRFGETGKLKALAWHNSVSCFSLEPERSAEVASAVSAYGPERVLAFYFLRVFTQERDRSTWSAADRDAEAERLLARRGAQLGLTSALPDVPAFERFWVEQGPRQHGWRELPQDLLGRGNRDSWLGDVAEHVNGFRDRQFVAVIAAAVADGERAFVVCGRSHAILIEPALRAAVGSRR